LNISEFEFQIFSSRGDRRSEVRRQLRTLRTADPSENRHRQIRNSKSAILTSTLPLPPSSPAAPIALGLFARRSQLLAACFLLFQLLNLSRHFLLELPSSRLIGNLDAYLAYVLPDLRFTERFG